MNETQTPSHDSVVDDAVEQELAGVPEDMTEAGDGDSSLALELAQLREELDAAKQEVLYARADTQNVRRRLEKDITDQRNYAATSFARDVLSVADNLTRAIDAVPEALREDEKFKGLVAGIEATQRELDKVFTNHGITRIAAKGMPLDPNQHQAMMELPSADVEPGIIVQEMQPGYMIKDRLLRPAMVVVAKAPE